MMLQNHYKLICFFILIFSCNNNYAFQNNNTYLTVTDAMSPEDLVSEYLMSSSCTQVYNVTFSTGTTFGTLQYGIAYFFNNNSNFPIEEGVLLSSGAYQNVPGPETGSQGSNAFGWPGDTDLENEVEELDAGDSFNATILEFDFVPFTETINFNFLFASDEYGAYQCYYSDAFAFLLTDTQGNSQNLAVVPGSNDPISVVTIRDEAYNDNCNSENINFFDTYYGENIAGNGGEDPLTSPTNFRGNTTVLNASSNVIIGEQYHIKLVIADRGDSILDSAVFIEAGSFDVGQINLGPDITANCNQQSVILNTGLPVGFAGNIEWFLNGNLITDTSGNPINTTNLEVTESGTYTVAISVGNAACASEDIIEVNFQNEIQLDLQGETSFCLGETYTIVATPTNASDFENLNYQWFFNGNVISNESSETLIVNAAGTYMVEINSDEQTECPPLTETIQLEAIDFEVSFSQSSTICFVEDEPTSLELIPDISGISPENLEEVVYLWENGEDTPSIQVTEPGDYQVTVFYENCEQTATIQLNFGKSPQINPILNEEICPEDSFVFSASIANSEDYNNVDFQWMNEQNEIVGNNAQLELFEPGNYTVIASAENIDGISCESSEEFNLSLKDIQLTLPENQVLCGIENFTINPTITGQDVNNPIYIWQDASGTVLSNAQQIMVNTDGTYTLTLQTGECILQKSIEINFFTVAQIDIGEDIITCDLQADLPFLDATPNNLNVSEVSFFWYYNGLLLANEISATLNTSLYGYGNYKVEVSVISAGQNCDNTVDQVSILKENEINVELNSNNLINTYCVGERVILSAAVTGSNDPENLDYVWFENGMILIGETNSSITFEMENSQPSTSIFEVEVGEGECLESATIEIMKYENEDCVITQGLSPNTSIGFNDAFDLRFLSDRSGIENIKIFNRYGTLVFEKSNYRDSFRGNDKNGNLLVTGTYFYIIKLKREDPVFGNLIKDWIYINQNTK